MMTDPAMPTYVDDIRRRRAADEILIAAIFGLSEREDDLTRIDPLPMLIAKADIKTAAMPVATS